MKPMPRSAVVLSLGVVVSAAAACLLTLFGRDAFPDPTPATPGNSVLAEARGWSAATLLVAVPLALVALRGAHRGVLRSRLVGLGVLAYFTYMDLELAVSPPFTALYLLYIAAFACAIPAFVIGVASVEVTALPVSFGEDFPRRTIAGFSLLTALLLAVAWLKPIVSHMLAGEFGWPVGEDAVQHVVHALDLGLQVPLGIATGVMLLRRRPVGLLLAAVFLINVVCMGAGLTGMVLWSTADAGTSPWIAAPFAVFWLMGVALALGFFRAGAHGSGPSPGALSQHQSEAVGLAGPHGAGLARLLGANGRA